MSKRSAAVQLTADNCEREEEDMEEPGQFEVASEEQLQQRVIKKARRGKTMNSEQTTSASGGLFAGIKFHAAPNGSGGLSAGFPSLVPTSSSSSFKPSFPSLPPNFSFGASDGKLASTSSSLLLPTFSSSTSSSLPLSSIFKPATTTSLPSTSPPSLVSKPPPGPPPPTSPPSSIPNPPPSTPPSGGEVDGEYLQQLRSLNLSVRDWIDKHVSQNPYVDLTPIFKDYETHLSNIDVKYRSAPSSVGSSQMTTDADTAQSGEETEEDVTVVAGSSPEIQPAADKPVSQTLQGEPDGDRPQGKFDSQSSQSELEADEDALHTVRSKLFYKKENSFTELGVGKLRVTKTAGSTDVQVLLRNDTLLGNILLNVRIAAGVPLSTKGNNVFLVCPPNPPLAKKKEGEPEEDPAKPVTYLLRVKTAAMANELVATIKNNL